MSSFWQFFDIQMAIFRRVSCILSLFSFPRETERRFVNKDSLQGSYRYGIKMATQRTDVNFARGTLSLPQRGPGGVSGGGCTMSPVRYLVDSTSQCVTSLTPGECQANTVFSANIYAVSSTIQGGAQSFKVRTSMYGRFWLFIPGWSGLGLKWVE